jgi:hypothetical protein
MDNMINDQFNVSLDDVFENTEVGNISVSNQTEIPDETEDTPPMETVKKKRGRKPKVKVDIESEIENVKSEEKDSLWESNLWTTKMSDIDENGLEFSEYGQKFRYEKLKSTSDVTETDGYISMCMIEGKHKDKWYISKNKILSKNYNVINLTSFIDNYLKSIFNFDKTQTPYVFYKNPFHILYRNQIGINGIQVFENEEDNLFFSIVSGISPDKLESCNLALNAQFINSYNGTKPFMCDFVTTFTFSDTDRKKYYLNDMFSLFNLSMTAHHNGAFNKSFDFSNVTNNIKENIQKLKNINEDSKLDFIVDELSNNKYIQIKPLKQFNKIWDNIEGGYRNAYSLLLVLSYAFENYFSIPKYILIKQKIAELLALE